MQTQKPEEDVLSYFPGYSRWDDDLNQVVGDKRDVCGVQAVEEVRLNPGVDDREEVYCASSNKVVPMLMLSDRR